ncbi:hypothetical protein [Ewingella americana]
MEIDAFPIFNFELVKYELDPKTICYLCKGSFEPSHLITVPEEKNICIKCAEILGDIAVENREKIRVSEIDGLIEKIMIIFGNDVSLEVSLKYRELAVSIYDAGYRKME